MEPEAIKLSIRSANNLIQEKIANLCPANSSDSRSFRDLINETRKWVARWKSKVLKFAWLRENFKYLWHRKSEKFCKIRVFNEFNTWLFVYSEDFRSFFFSFDFIVNLRSFVAFKFINLLFHRRVTDNWYSELFNK